MLENETITGAESGRTHIRLNRRRKLSFGYQLIWPAERLGGGPAPGRAATIDGGVVEVEIVLVGNLLWKVRRERSPAHVLAWRADARLPEVAARVIDILPRRPPLTSGLQALVPEATGKNYPAEVIERLSEAIVELCPKALERWFVAVVAEAWRNSSEAHPLLDFRVRLDEDVEESLQRMAQQEWGRGEGVPLRPAFAERVDLLLRLPPLNRVTVRRWHDVLAQSHIELEGDGGIAVGPQDSEPALKGVLVTCGGHLAGQTSADAKFKLIFEHHQRNSANRSRFLLPKMLQRYGLEHEARAWLDGRTGEVHAGIHVSVGGEATASWLAFPQERRAIFYDQFAVVSRAAQRVLRAWLPYLHFQDFSRFDDTNAARPLLAFSQMPLFRSKERVGFTHEVLRPSQLQKALRRVTKPLMALFVEIRQKLEEEGRSEFVHAYTGRQAMAVARAMGVVPKPFGILMQAEIQLVGNLMEFCSRASGFQKHPEQLYPAGAALAEALASRLRRIYSHQLFVPLAALILVEATHALAVEQGRQTPGRVVVRLREDDGPEYAAAVSLR